MSTTTASTSKKAKTTQKPESQQKSKEVTSAKTSNESKKQHKVTKTQKTSGGRNQRLGRLGEDMACYYLESNDLTILERNWKCSSGEADIIAEEDNTLVFVEVKTRSQDHAGLPEYAVTKQKRERYEKIAICYLTQNPRSSGRVRFDVIAIRLTGEQQCLLRHHRDAFASGE